MSWPKGVPRSPETRALQSAIAKAQFRALSPEQRAERIARASRNLTPMTPEHRYIPPRGVPLSEQTRQRMSVSIRRALAERKARLAAEAAHPTIPGEPPA
jgi:hypothetical protein